MAAPVEELVMYYEDSVNLYSTAQTPFNKRSAPVGSGATTTGFPSSLPLMIGNKSNASTAGDFYYFHDEASDVGGYKKLLYAPSDVAKKSSQQNINAGDLMPVDKLIGAWMTEPGVPGFTGTISSGTWQTNLRQRRDIDSTSYISGWTIRWYRYYNDIDFGWTLSGQIAFTIFGSATNTEQTVTFTHTVLSSTWGPTDRLVCKIWASFDEVGATV